MTWLSRLLPQSPSLQRLANDNHRTRQAQRRRRQATLETLEGRTLLSASQVLVLPVGALAPGQTTAIPGQLTIVTDSHSSLFNINENGGNKVTITPSGLTYLNNNSVGVPITKSQVTSIYVEVDTAALPGTSQNSPVITLTETAGANSGIKTVAVEIYGTSLTSGPDLNLTVTSVKNTGAFSVQDYVNTAPSVPIYYGGALTLSVTGSQFSQMNIEQYGCCQANVSLAGDTTIAHGAVSVSEGYYGAKTQYNPNLAQALGDTITFHYDNFGPTTFTLGNGPAPYAKGAQISENGGKGECCDNAWSQITGDDSNLTNLYIAEPNSGTNQSIVVGSPTSDVEISDTPGSAVPGIVAYQGCGNFNTILIQSITTSGHPNNELAPTDSISTIQGNGSNDSAIVDSAQVFGNITSCQGNGGGDFVGYYGNTAGFYIAPVPGSAYYTGPYILEVFGCAKITQGDGMNDVVTLDCGIENGGLEQFFNNVSISQGSGDIYANGCDQATGDTINVNWTWVTSNMCLAQGEYYGSTDPGTELGSNFINIGTTSPVYVGYSTVINEIGEYNQNNTITLGGINGPDSGDSPVDFETGYLDVYTGAGGGSSVQAEDTQVDYGALGIFATSDGNPYCVTGGGTGNAIALDVFSSVYVSADPTFAVLYLP